MNAKPEVTLPVCTFNLINVMRLRDHLFYLNEKESKPKIGFNMAFYRTKKGQFAGTYDISHHSCDTVACLAGHASMLSNKFVKASQISSVAKKWLGLTDQECMYLFSGSFSKECIQCVTLKETIAELDFMIQNGRTSGVYCP